MRKKIIAGNWKMHLNRLDAIALVKDVLNRAVPLQKNTEVIFAPSFVYLDQVALMCADTSNIYAAAQDCSASGTGAYTGEVSANMLASCSVKYVILGHSERRANFNERNKLLKLKVEQVLANKLEVIFCCGESLEQREAGVHFEWIKSQISEGLFHLSSDKFNKIVIAYEPVWAIGTGVTASSDQAQEMHSFIRRIIEERYGNEVSNNTSILYGGSCKPTNAIELFSQADVDGGLIGGASLNSDDFLSIIDSL